jgi:hypothetical protein
MRDTISLGGHHLAASTLAYNRAVIVIVIVVLLAVQTFNYPPGTWSYAILAPKDEDLTKELNEAGALGWEVVSARRATSGQGGSSTASYEMILKRRGAAHLQERSAH